MEKIKPKRIQRKRTRGFKLSTDNPNGFVYVGRPTKWGNPYIPESPDEFQDAVDYYKSWQEVLIAKGYNHDFSELRGRDLACWCPLDSPCHADVLLRMAND